MKKLDVILIGGGDRGINYTTKMSYIPEKYRVIAVAEPIDDRRNHIRDMHNIPEEMCFTDWKPLLEKG